MMKKRNIAVAMAAVTVASTVAPAFANNKVVDTAEDNKFTVSKENRDKVITKVGQLLRKKYDDGKSVYSINVSYYNGTKTVNEEIKTANDLENIIKDTKNTDIVLTITDKGHVEDANGITNKAIMTYDDNDSLYELATRVNNEVKKDNGILSAKFKANSPAETTITLGSNIELFDASISDATGNNDELLKTDISKEFTVKPGDYEIDFGFDEVDTLNVELDGESKQKSIKTLLSELKESFDNNIETLGDIDNASLEDKSLLKEMLKRIAGFDVTESDLDNKQVESINNLLEGEDGLKALVSKLKKIDTSSDENKLKEILGLLKDKSKFDALKFIAITQELDKVVGLHEKGLRPIDPTNYEVSIADSKIDTVKADTLFDGLMLTEKGKDLVDALENGIEIDGKLFEDIEADGDYKISKLANDSYELVMNFIGTYTPESNRSVNSEEFKFQIKVTAKTRTELEEIADIFTLTSNGVAGANVNSIIGSRRTETAVQISKENFKGNKIKTKDGNVVLVGANAVVDGLAAGPLAKLLDAPVLLTSKDSLDVNVENEIKRLLVNETTTSNLSTQTVYIVGGESVVSENVVDQLEKLGIKVERLAGDRRDTTSLAVAEKMVEKKAKFDQAFVVGATGEADAMSIAAHAAREEAPIIVTALDGTLSKEAKRLINRKQIDIIGGETVVSKELEEELIDIDKDEKVVRVKGSNRAETNANVIKKYYSGAKHVYIAKDGKVEGNDKLVDALAISPIAADKNGVVVLATNDLTEEQESALELRASGATKLIQVGGGVSETIVTKVAKLLGLVK